MLPLIMALAPIVPSIVKLFSGSPDDKKTTIVEGATELLKSITGEQDPVAALEKLKANQEYQTKFQELWNQFELGIQEQLTRRHEADMVSDSWMAKNIRPYCLLFITLAIAVGVLLPDTYVSADRYTALTDLAVWVYGYYFVGRSAEKTELPNVFKKR